MPSRKPIRAGFLSSLRKVWLMPRDTSERCLSRFLLLSPSNCRSSAAAAVDFGISGQAVAQAERTDEHIAVAAVFLNFGRDGDKGSGAGLNVNWRSKFGTAVFAVDIGNGSVEFQFTLVRHDVFDIQRQVGADNQRRKDNE